MSERPADVSAALASLEARWGAAAPRRLTDGALALVPAAAPDEDAGESVTVSYGQYRAILATRREQADRAAAFEALHKTYQGSLNTYAAIYNGAISRDGRSMVVTRGVQARDAFLITNLR